MLQLLPVDKSLNEGSVPFKGFSYFTFQPSFEFKEWDPELPPVCQPNLDFLAPEYAISMSCSLSSDMFSMGVLICTIFNNGKPLYECKNQLSLFKKYTEEVGIIGITCPFLRGFLIREKLAINSIYVCNTGSCFNKLLLKQFIVRYLWECHVTKILKNHIA